MSGKCLTYKLVMLMALTSASRASVIHCLDISFMVKLEDTYIFIFHKLHKNRRKGKAPPKTIFIKALQRSRTVDGVCLR